ncbi:protein kinase domain-containing protein [Haliangium sp.]|uniref:serine/threonine-protein kinase n=1 Tax=Haliangium sp. TaxID=2663208 RepID=UPI003D0A15BA
MSRPEVESFDGGPRPGRVEANTGADGAVGDTELDDSADPRAAGATREPSGGGDEPALDTVADDGTDAREGLWPEHTLELGEDEASDSDDGGQWGVLRAEHLQRAVWSDMPRRVGRFVILRELGRGGMGVAYLAYDEQLERKLAVKLVRARADADAGAVQTAQERLLREARTMARLVHPNIVTVHEVGKYGPQVYMAMEFVRGQTLDRWRDAKIRDWREVVAVFRQAGAGLMAAHGAGLVHRDFKPTNVIVGDDGRVRVLDFGLVRAIEGTAGLDETYITEAAARASSTRLTSVEDSALTRSGAVVGTPGYVAPEQIASNMVDEAADQFAFCVTLYESLYGHRPFAGKDNDALRRAILAGRVREPSKDSKVPGWLRAVVLRGLRAEPEERWPSMEALLEALARDPARRRRRIAAGVGAAAVVSAALVLSMTVGRSGDDRGGVICSGAEEQVAEVWNPPRRYRVQGALMATGVPYAGSTWQHVERIIDRYTAAWVEAHRDACEATAVRREQSDEIMDRRMACLETRRRALDALLGAIAEVDAEGINRVAGAVSQLPHVESCADTRFLQSGLAPPEDPLVAEIVTALRVRLARAREQDKLGAYERAAAQLEELVAAARSLDYEPLVAEIDAVRGRVSLHLGDYEVAHDLLEEAYFTARASFHDEVAIEAATLLVGVAGNVLARIDEAQRWARHAQAEITRAGSDEQHVRLLNNLGAVRQREGKYAESAEYFEQSLALALRLWGEANYVPATVTYNLGYSFLLQGRYEEAEQRLQRALAVWEQILGPEHPNVADALQVLGQISMERADLDQAEVYLRRSLSMQQQLLGEGHIRVSSIHLSLGELYERAGTPARAAEHCRRALEIREQVLGAPHFQVAEALEGMARAQLALGADDEALALARRAMANLEGSQAEPVLSADVAWVLAQALAAKREEPARALELALQARAMYIAGGASRGRRLAAIEAWLAEVEAAVPAPAGKLSGRAGAKP